MASIQHAKRYITALSTGKVSGDIPKFTVVTGGTTGIGPSIAIALARIGCERIIIVGRNVTAGNLVVSQMREENQDGNYSLIQGDLSHVGDTSSDSRSNRQLWNQSGLSHHVSEWDAYGGDQTYRGRVSAAPTYGRELMISHGLGFAVQALSRFHLPYHLINSNGLAIGARVICLANPGVSLNDLDVEDLSLKNRENQWSAKLFIQQSMRDSTVLDSFLQEMTARYPNFQFYHIHPGFVKTPTMDLSVVPRPFSWLMTAAYYTIATTPEHIANIPVYLAVVDAQGRLDLGPDRFFNHNLKAISPGLWSQNEANRQKMWSKLVDLVKQ